MSNYYREELNREDMTGQTRERAMPLWAILLLFVLLSALPWLASTP
jgi:hypothetical protein